MTEKIIVTLNNKIMGLNNNFLQQIKSSTVFKLAIIGTIATILAFLIDYFIPGSFGLIPFLIAGYTIIYSASAGLVYMIAEKDDSIISRFCKKHNIISAIILSIIISFLMTYPILFGEKSVLLYN